MVIKYGLISVELTIEHIIELSNDALPRKSPRHNYATKMCFNYGHL